SLPLTLVILVFVFGGLVAAGLPVLAAVFSAGSVMTVLLAFSTFTDLDNNTVTVVTLLALGLSIDYGLLLVGRYREELGGGHPPELATPPRSASSPGWPGSCSAGRWSPRCSPARRWSVPAPRWCPRPCTSTTSAASPSRWRRSPSRTTSPAGSTWPRRPRWSSSRVPT